MKTTKIVIKNLFGIEEKELDGSSVEISGTNGTGKTSVIDAIKYALTNKSDRDYIIRSGEREGEILIETDAGISISRKKRTDKADYKSIRSGGKEIPSPESFLTTLFTPLQLNPVEFLALSKQEQNRAILDLIDFKWDINWIKEQFGEVPGWVDYSKNILEVLAEIQSEKGDYFMDRQDINRDIRNKKAFIEEIAATLPEGYKADDWRNYDVGKTYDVIIKAEQDNSRIQRAKLFLDSYENKVRGIDADGSIQKSNIEKAFADKKSNLLSKIERLKGEISTCEKELSMMGDGLKKEYELIDTKIAAEKEKLSHDMGVAEEYAGKEFKDVSKLKEEVQNAEAMKQHINEYDRMQRLNDEIDTLTASAERLTAKIEKARALPGEILKNANIPVEGLTVVDGKPLVNGLPISNLSEGEKLSLCVDVAAANPNALSLILLDGVEKLSEENRKKLYAKWKEKGLQFIATRTTDNNDLLVTSL